MGVRYKHNKKLACYSSGSLITSPKTEASSSRLRGPFASCGDCPYAHHGFLCYSKEGDCMKTYLQRMTEKRKLAVGQRKTEVCTS